MYLRFIERKTLETPNNKAITTGRAEIMASGFQYFSRPPEMSEFQQKSISNW